MEDIDVQAVVKQALQEFVSSEQAKSEPAYQAELLEERKRREPLERRGNELEEENKRSRLAADEGERGSGARAGIEGVGAAESGLGFKAGADAEMPGPPGG